MDQLSLLSQTFTSHKVKPAGALPDDSTDTGLQPQCIPVHNEENIKSLHLRQTIFEKKEQLSKEFLGCFNAWFMLELSFCASRVILILKYEKLRGVNEGF